MKNAFLAIIVCVLLCTPVFAQEKIPTDSADYWCGAFWPPGEGADRTRGIDVNGDVCIKIVREVETTVEVVDVVEVEVPAEIKETEITVTLKNDDNGKPIMSASCPTAFSWYRLRAVAIENGCVEKLRVRDGKTYIMFEDCK